MPAAAMGAQHNKGGKQAGALSAAAAGAAAAALEPTAPPTTGEGAGAATTWKGHDLQRYCKIAEDVAMKAGQFIRASLEKREQQGLRVNHKAAAGSAQVDLVTEVDLQAEEIIIPSIRKAVHGHGHIFVGEESAFLSGVQDLTDAPHWFVDPLDGTTNFVHGYPFVTVSIGLLIEKTPVVGVIYNPFLEEMYTAYLGGGAFLNGRRLQVSSLAKHVGEAMIATTLGSSRDRPYLNSFFFRLRELLLHKLQAFRISGSTAQNLAHVASGKLDLFFDEGGFGGPWDVAAGIVLVSEAGGVVKAIDGGEYKFHTTGKSNIICGNGALIPEVVAVIEAAHRKMWKKGFMIQVRGWGTIGAIMCAAFAVSLFVGGRKPLSSGASGR